MIYIGLIFFCLYSFTAGARDGISMYQPTNRVHPWYWTYHLLRPVEALGLILGTICLWNEEQAWNIWFILGALILMWELFENGYKIARLGQVKNHENLMGILVLNGETPVKFLHIARWILGTGFLLIFLLERILTYQNNGGFYETLSDFLFADDGMLCNGGNGFFLESR